MDHTFKCPSGIINHKASLPKYFLDNTFIHFKLPSITYSHFYNWLSQIILFLVLLLMKQYFFYLNLITKWLI